MAILFMANLAETYQHELKQAFPAQRFIFRDKVEDVTAHFAEAEIIVTYGEDITEEIISQAVQLKWLMVLSAGVEQLPFDMLTEREIVVTNVRGIHKVPMAEYALSMLLQVARDEQRMLQNSAQKSWDRSLAIEEITGKTLLVVGAGAIGQEVARLGQAFRMKTLGVSRSGRALAHFDENYQVSELSELLPQADFIVSVLPSTPATQDLFTLKQFNAMKETAIFLNMGRGDAVVEADLLTAIQQGAFAHAILDVFRSEPLSTDHPFWEEANITVTPHTAAQSAGYVPRALAIFKENLGVYLRGDAAYVNEIDTERRY